MSGDGAGRGGNGNSAFRRPFLLSRTRAHQCVLGEFLFDSEILDDARIEFARSVAGDPTTDAYNRLGEFINCRS